MKYKEWTLTDTNKKRFIAEAAINTRVKNIMFDMDNSFTAGVPIEHIIVHSFGKFEWFLKNNADVKDCNGHHHFNFVRFAQMLTDKIKNDYEIDKLVHFDGTMTQ